MPFPINNDPSKKLTEFESAHIAGFQFGQTQAEVLVIEGKNGAEDGVPFAFVNGQAVNLKQFMPPRLGKMSPHFLDAKSLIWYVKKYKTEDTIVFAEFTQTSGTFTAVLDYPAAGEVSRKEHVATFTLKTTPEWDALLAINRKDKNQDDFCEFVERWPKLFVSPRGTDMLEMARYIEGKKEGAFTFGKKLSNGDRETFWKEQTQINAGATGNGEVIPVPESLEFSLSLFEGTEPVSVDAFLRIKVSGGKLLFVVDIKYMERILREAMQNMRDTIRDDAGVVIVLGSVGHSSGE